MTLRQSKRCEIVSQSEIRSMTRECARIDGINMAQGICDLDAPPCVVKWAKDAMDAGHNTYSSCEGLAELRRAVAVKMKAYYVLVDISRVPGNDDKDRVMHILERTGVACVPGRSFYHDDSGSGVARFCFAKKSNTLSEACVRIQRLCL